MKFKAVIVAAALTSLGGCVSINVTETGEDGYSSDCNRTAYLVQTGSLRNADALVDYREAHAYQADHFDGRVLTQQRPTEVLDGAMSGSEVMMLTKFPCLRKAREFWASSQNSGLAEVREQAGDLTVAIYERGLYVNF